MTLKENSAGSNGLFGGASLMDKDNYPRKAAQTGTRSLTIPTESTGGTEVGTGQKGSLKNKAQMAAEDMKNFERMRHQIETEISGNPKLAKLAKHVHFVRTRDGLRIDLVDDADYSMFALGTTQLEPAARKIAWAHRPVDP